MKLFAKRPPRNGRLAAIDLGTNSFHLVVAQFDEKGRYEILAREKEPVRLGSGAGDMERITPEAVERGLVALERFARLAQSLGADLRAVATSAVREARNQAEFLQAVRERCGIDVEVIPGVEEARLIYLGVLQALPVFDERVLTIDIGGGSTEFLLGRQGHVDYATSLKLGAIRLKDRFFPSEPLKPKQIARCRKFVRVSLSHVSAEVARHGFATAIGSSGTIGCLTEMIARRNGTDDSKTFTDKDLDWAVELLVSKSTARERVRVPGIDERRADIIVGGAVLLQECFRVLGIRKLLYSPFALREGILFDSLARLGKAQTPGADLRRESVEHLAERMAAGGLFSLESSRNISRLAQQLFTQLRELGLLDELLPEDLTYLEYAGILHNIGIVIAQSAHHKHSYYIIHNTEKLLGFEPEEIDLLALLARYHRKALPAEKHIEYTNATPWTRRRVRKLAPILRLAIGLDRGGTGAVQSVQVRRAEGKLSFAVRPAPGPRKTPREVVLEVWAARMKADWFEDEFGIKTEFHPEYD